MQYTKLMKQYRFENDLSQEQMAEKLGMKSQQVYSGIERGITKLTYDFIVKYKEVTGIDLANADGVRDNDEAGGESEGASLSETIKRLVVEYNALVRVVKVIKERVDVQEKEIEALKKKSGRPRVNAVGEILRAEDLLKEKRRS